MFVIVINGWFILYLGSMWLSGDMIVQPAYEVQNSFYYLVLIGVGLYVLVNYSIKQFHLSWSRTTLSSLGLFLLVVGHYVLANNGADQIFVWDIVKVIGVIFIIAGPAKLFLSEKKEQQIKESKMEVIEA